MLEEKFKEVGSSLGDGPPENLQRLLLEVGDLAGGEVRGEDESHQLRVTVFHTRTQS